MTGLACLFGLHSPEGVTLLCFEGGVFVQWSRVRCARCHAPISEEVKPVGDLPASGDGAL